MSIVGSYLTCVQCGQRFKRASALGRAPLRCLACRKNPRKESA